MGRELREKGRQAGGGEREGGINSGLGETLGFSWRQKAAPGRWGSDSSTSRVKEGRGCPRPGHSHLCGEALQLERTRQGWGEGKY